MELKNVNKAIKNSLNFLDNEYVYMIIVIVLFLYNSMLFTNINGFVSNIYDFGVVRVLILILILYLAQKSPLISILLAISYVLSVKGVMDNFTNNEYFETDEEVQGVSDLDQVDGPADYNLETNESFIPNMMANQPRDDLNNKLENRMEENKVMENNENNEELNNDLNRTNCLNNYVPVNRPVGNVCSPMNTFEGEFNTQGLNYPIGFDQGVIDGGMNLNPK